MTSFDGKYLTFYLMAIGLVMFALSLIVYKIFSKQEKFPKCDLQNEGQGHRVQEWNMHHSTGNVRIHIGDFYFSEFWVLATYVYAKGNRKRATGVDYRQNLPSRFS